AQARHVAHVAGELTDAAGAARLARLHQVELRLAEVLVQAVEQRVGRSHVLAENCMVRQRLAPGPSPGRPNGRAVPGVRPAAAACAPPRGGRGAPSSQLFVRPSRRPGPRNPNPLTGGPQKPKPFLQRSITSQAGMPSATASYTVCRALMRAVPSRPPATDRS